ncbi:hypothetical protein HPB51_013589 [Rhipicephalus microplus]|uniref:THAP-type domain-containing protein n=1 Tax=Rhipicephalus microplus TaxID=6941 RepID=A0A9J6DUY7_RHIMP|nr:hypothetical protein HPB51_013589 [Rhipicephalus microplus]
MIVGILDPVSGALAVVERDLDASKTSGCRTSTAVSCSNLLKKGFALYRFPQGDRNRARHRVWEVRTKWDKLKANDNSRLSGVHFEFDQFESFRKGPKKLKCTAVPTLFLHCADKKKRKPP